MQGSDNCFMAFDFVVEGKHWIPQNLIPHENNDFTVCERHVTL